VSKTVKGALTMACEAFIDYRPRTPTIVVIDQAVAIIAEYSRHAGKNANPH
jgi:hypothetical protein